MQHRLIQEYLASVCTVPDGNLKAAKYRYNAQKVGGTDVVRGAQSPS